MSKKKDNRTLNNRIDLFRIIVMSVFFGAFILLFLFKLVHLQVVKHDDYASEVVPKTYRTHTVEMSRGHIYDRNGVPLAVNKKIYNVVVDIATINGKDYNTVILEFISFCTENGIDLTDNLPISEKYPFNFDEDYIFDEVKEKQFESFVKQNELANSGYFGTDDSFYRFLCDRYGSSDADIMSKQYRRLIGIRYDMECNSFGFLDYHVILSDISEETVALVSENLHKFHGIKIATEDKREYALDNLACHVLGRIGKIDAPDVDVYVNQNGYSYDELIGREGVEKAFEHYLHGYNGIERYEIDDNNNVVGIETVKEPKNGYSVNLTIDAGMQRVAETALQEQIDAARSIGLSDTIPYNGEDCDAGSVVVMNPKNGDVYVCASLPNYNLNTYSDDISRLLSDESTPLVNRSTQGIYPPGSTFKIATAVAALVEGVITPNVWINDTGRYTAYDDYQPACWSLLKRGYGHGPVDLKTAIEESCNYYFYKIADDMGIEALKKHASLLGLGQKTGIEIPESVGILASPEYKNSKGYLWNPGDTLQAAIGQSDNAFTPIQLCSYMSTVVNGGTRYKATLLDSVVDFYTGKVVYNNEAEVLSTVDLPKDTVEILKSAMKSVVDEGTASSVFLNYEHEVGGKTGTAQVSSGSDTVLFVGFAPYDDPEIVVSVVVEHGDQSSRASLVAKAVFDYYFETYKK